MNKIKLRQYALEKRKTLKYNKEEFKRDILNRLNLPTNSLIAIYKPLKYEFDLTFLEDIYNVCYPKTFNNDMEFYRNVNSFSKSSFGVLEPIDGIVVNKDEIDLMFVPSLLVNKEGYRIGYGKGYYDRYLKDSNIKTISVVYEELYLEFSCEKHDVKVDEVIICKR